MAEPSTTQWFASHGGDATSFAPFLRNLQRAHRVAAQQATTGYLERRQAGHINFKRRYASLFCGALELVEDEEEYRVNVRKRRDDLPTKTEHSYKLVGSRVVPNPDPMSLTLELYLHGGSVLSLRCESPGDMSDWQAAFELHISVANEEAILDADDDSDALFDWFMALRAEALEAAERLKSRRTFNKKYPVALGLFGTSVHPKDVFLGRDGKALLCGNPGFTEQRPNPYALPYDPSVPADRKKLAAPLAPPPPKPYKEYPLSGILSVAAPMDEPLAVVISLTPEKDLTILSRDCLLRDKIYKDLHLVLYYSSLTPFRREWSTGTAKRGVEEVLDNMEEGLLKGLGKTKDVFEHAFSKDGELAKVFGKDGVIAGGVLGALDKVGIKTKRASGNEAQLKEHQKGLGLGKVNDVFKGVGATLGTAAKSAGSAIKNLDKGLS